MRSKLAKINTSIWGLALGYFAFYVPYSSMTKSLSKGLFPNMEGAISGFEILPAVIIGTIIGFCLILATTQWWRFAGKVSLGNFKVPFATSKMTFFSGIATAVIIATTTLAYSFTGISIVFAALLMRGGVLLIAPFVDIVYKRKIYWYSWLAFGLTLFSLLVVFSEKGGYTLTWAAGINILAYLAGYFFRLQFMTHTAKSDDKQTNYKYFVEEMMSAMLTLLIVPAVLAIVGYGELMLELRSGYTTFLSTPSALPALLIGALYSALYIFGSRIYLDQRENTFCIPINRCASLLAGVVGALILSLIFDKSFVSPTQLLGAMILVTAIISLRTADFIEMFKNLVMKQLRQERVFIFVCPGNTGRSPMAQSICYNKLRAQVTDEIGQKRFEKTKILSAGIEPQVGIPTQEDAKMALTSLGVEPVPHTSTLLSYNEIKLANRIYCMSQEHKNWIEEKYPAAQGKIKCIDPNDAVPVPHGKGVQAYIDCAQKLDRLIDDLLYKDQLQLN